MKVDGLTNDEVKSHLQVVVDSAMRCLVVRMFVRRFVRAASEQSI